MMRAGKLVRAGKLLLLASCPSVEATRMLAFGDSWAWLGFPQFEKVFASQNISTALHAIPGTPAGYWALIQPDALIKAVDESNADAVYLSIGGNDFLEGLPAGHLVELIHAEMLAATRSMIDRLLAARPHVHVYHFGYELLDWGSDPLCKAFGLLELFGKSPLCLDVANVTCMTHAQATWLQTKFIDKGLAPIYKEEPRYHPLNLLGTLQAAAGLPGAKVGAPVWSQFSPGPYVRSGLQSFGCVHLTPLGYTVLYKEFYRQIASSLRGPPASSRQIATLLPPARDEQGLEERAQAEAREVEAEAVEEGVEQAVGAWRRPCVSDSKRLCWVLRAAATANAGADTDFGRSSRKLQCTYRNCKNSTVPFWVVVLLTIGAVGGLICCLCCAVSIKDHMEARARRAQEREADPATSSGDVQLGTAYPGCPSAEL